MGDRFIIGTHDIDQAVLVEIIHHQGHGPDTAGVSDGNLIAFEKTRSVVLVEDDVRHSRLYAGGDDVEVSIQVEISGIDGRAAAYPDTERKTGPLVVVELCDGEMV